MHFMKEQGLFSKIRKQDYHITFIIFRIVHLHVRDDNGKATDDPAKYKEVLEGLREAAPELLVEFTTTNFAPTVEEQVACLRQ